MPPQIDEVSEEVLPTAEAGLSDEALQLRYDSAFAHLEDLQKRYEAAPSASTLLPSQKRGGKIEVRESIKPQLDEARRSANDKLAEINRRKRAKVAEDRLSNQPGAKTPPGTLPKTTTQYLYQRNRMSSTLRDEFYPVDEDGSPAAEWFTGGSSGGASGIAAQGAMLRAKLQNAVQNRRLDLDEAKLVKDTYFDALTEARQRENIAQDALAAGERASAQAMTTERSKMANVVTPQDLALWRNAVNSLGEVSGSPFRVPEDWVSGHAPVGVNPELLGPGGLDVPAQAAGRAVEGWNMTAPQIHERVGAQAQSFRGGYTPEEQAIADLAEQARQMADAVGVQ